MMKVLAVLVFAGVLLCLSACALTPPLQIPEGAAKYSGTVRFSGTDSSHSLTTWLVEDGAQLRGIYTLLNDRGQVTLEPTGKIYRAVFVSQQGRRCVAEVTREGAGWQGTFLCPGARGTTGTIELTREP